MRAQGTSLIAGCGTTDRGAVTTNELVLFDAASLTGSAHDLGLATGTDVVATVKAPAVHLC
jgi:molybdopterin-binding protein